MDAVLDLRALAHEESATVEQLAAPARRGVRNPDRGEQIGAEQFRELAGVDGVRLGACLPDELDLARVGDAHGVALGIELVMEPLPVEAGEDRRRASRLDFDR